MRNLFKKSVAFGMAAVMTVGMTGIVSARVADNTNIASSAKWTGFSVQTDDRSWVQAEFEATGKEPGTNGYIDSQSASGFVMNVVNSGWDGEYNTHTNPPVLAKDNPYGLTVTSSQFDVEAGRSYTISYKIQSTLKEIDKGEVIDKYLFFKVYTPGGGDPALDLASPQGCDSQGYMTLTRGKDPTTVSATFTVKDDYKGGKIGVKFAFGAFLKTHPDQINMSGKIIVTDFAITANHQYTVKYVDGSSTVTKYVNPNGKVTATTPVKKGYAFNGWYLNGSKYNFNAGVTGDITLTAKWTKVKAPTKAKIKKLKSSKSKKLTVTLKKTKNAEGYQVQYANNKKFKSKKTKTTKKLSYTISKLKSGVKYYVRVKAYKTDSTGKKYYSKKWSAVKSAYVR